MRDLTVGRFGVKTLVFFIQISEKVFNNVQIKLAKCQNVLFLVVVRLCTKQPVNFEG